MNRPMHLEMPGDAAGFLPGVGGHDALARHWLAQVAWRLRRELCWLWRERALQDDGVDARALPPPVDPALAALDLARHAQERQRFFDQDVTAAHLTAFVARPEPGAVLVPRGGFGWLVQVLSLAPVERFVLALALLPGVDAAAGAVVAACQNDPQRSAPTLALAQRLWDAPDDVLVCFDPAHALLRHGILAWQAAATGVVAQDWHAPLAVPPLVARKLLFPGAMLPAALQRLDPGDAGAAATAGDVARVAAALRGTQAGGDGAPTTGGASDANRTARGLRVQPVLGPHAAAAAQAAAWAAEAGVQTLQPAPGLAREHLPQAMTVAWLRGDALCVPLAAFADSHLPLHEHGAPAWPLPGLPLLLFVTHPERAALRAAVPADAPPALQVPLPTHAQRVQRWAQAVPALHGTPMLAELARRFRLEPAAIARVGAELAALGRAPTEAEALAAARADLDLGTLAQPVEPRFTLRELMLPPLQARQMDEIVQAMRNLTRVHHEWGTARAWSEAGLSVLFAGPPGTGKTMAAEALARELQLPLVRIDLSQVVNKYIGETEKNLRRLFDAADAGDTVLFFDEADALFGRRTEVRDAHDRYANLETSYLLERMERLQGLAILATNRRKDLDEAFARRLRFVVEFPLPGADERLRIWQGAIPEGVDASALDLPWLARRFALAGGHIRGIVFHACLQSAAAGAARRLEMPAVVRAVRREYDKLDRAVSLDQFGPWAPLVAEPEKPA